MTQPEALRIADGLEGNYSVSYQSYAAAELRRLHDLNQDKAGQITRLSRKLISVVEENGRLREAARMALEALERPNQGLRPVNGEWRSVPSLAIDALRDALGEEK